MNKYTQKRNERMLEQHFPIAWYKFFMWVVLPCFAAFSMSGIIIDATLWITGVSADPLGVHLIVYGTMGIVLVFTVYTFYNMYVMRSYRALLSYIIVLPCMIVLNKLLPLILYIGLMINPDSVTSSVVISFLFLGTSLLYFPRRKLLFDDMHYRYIDWRREHDQG